MQVQLVKNYVSHLEDLKMKREKRSQENKLRVQRQETRPENLEDEEEYTEQQEMEEENEDRDAITQIIGIGETDADDYMRAVMEVKAQRQQAMLQRQINRMTLEMEYKNKQISTLRDTWSTSQ